MASKKITAEVDGVTKTFTLDVPANATNDDIAKAIADYHPDPPPVIASKRRIEGAQAQLGEPTQPTGGDWLTNLGNTVGGMTMGGPIAGTLGKIARPALAAMMGAGTTAAAGGSPIEGGVTAGALGALGEGTGALTNLFSKRKALTDAIEALKGQNLPTHNAAKIEALKAELDKTADPKKLIKSIGVGTGMGAGYELLRHLFEGSK